jgi:hypothetical protein
VRIAAVYRPLPEREPEVAAELRRLAASHPERKFATEDEARSYASAIKPSLADGLATEISEQAGYLKL